MTDFGTQFAQFRTKSPQEKFSEFVSDVKTRKITAFRRRGGGGGGRTVQRQIPSFSSALLGQSFTSRDALQKAEEQFKARQLIKRLAEQARIEKAGEGRITGQLRKKQTTVSLPGPLQTREEEKSTELSFIGAAGAIGRNIFDIGGFFSSLKRGGKKPIEVVRASVIPKAIEVAVGLRGIGSVTRDIFEPAGRTGFGRDKFEIQSPFTTGSGTKITTPVGGFVSPSKKSIQEIIFEQRFLSGESLETTGLPIKVAGDIIQTKISDELIGGFQSLASEDIGKATGIFQEKIDIGELTLLQAEEGLKSESKKIVKKREDEFNLKFQEQVGVAFGEFKEKREKSSRLPESIIDLQKLPSQVLSTVAELGLSVGALSTIGGTAVISGTSIGRGSASAIMFAETGDKQKLLSAVIDIGVGSLFARGLVGSQTSIFKTPKGDVRLPSNLLERQFQKEVFKDFKITSQKQFLRPSGNKGRLGKEFEIDVSPAGLRDSSGSFTDLKLTSKPIVSNIFDFKGSLVQTNILSKGGAVKSGLSLEAVSPSTKVQAIQFSLGSGKTSLGTTIIKSPTLELKGIGSKISSGIETQFAPTISFGTGKITERSFINQFITEIFPESTTKKIITGSRFKISSGGRGEIIDLPLKKTLSFSGRNIIGEPITRDLFGRTITRKDFSFASGDLPFFTRGKGGIAARVRGTGIEFDITKSTEKLGVGFSVPRKATGRLKLKQKQQFEDLSSQLSASLSRQVPKTPSISLKTDQALSGTGAFDVLLKRKSAFEGTGQFERTDLVQGLNFKVLGQRTTLRSKSEFSIQPRVDVLSPSLISRTRGRDSFALSNLKSFVSTKSFIGTSFSQKSSSKLSQSLKTGQVSLNKRTFPKNDFSFGGDFKPFGSKPSSTSPPLTGFGGFPFLIPFKPLGGTGKRKRRVKGKVAKKVLIKPSFTASTFRLFGKFPKPKFEGLGLLPSQLRVIPNRRKAGRKRKK